VSHAIGVDVGGTFTDVVVSGADGRLTVAKAPTTPGDQSEGVLAGLALAAASLGMTTEALLAGASRVVHGTTVATNALLEGKTARVGMLTTAGHRDVIEMREGLKPDRYDLRMAPPPVLVPRALRLGVVERMRSDGRVERTLDADSLDAALETLAEAEVDAVAVCFLHAWRDPAHEREAAARARARLQGAYVTASSDVLPVIKEFERFSTTVANAAVGPVIAAYLARLRSRLEAAGLRAPLFVMLSHGGVASAEEAARLPAGTALSGPAGGVAASVAMARDGAGADLITFDMGGTSTDIAVVRGGRAELSSGRSVGGARIALPSLDIVTLGAGGGSIAHLDRSGLLRVGPESAGAMPGPACYGQGGTEATVTDANLVLGLLDPAAFLGGRRRLDAEAAERAIAALAARLGLSSEDAAAGIHRLVNARMADGVRVATVRRGVDPRRHALLAFGGAAGLHVAGVAAELGIARVIVPVQASVLSAWGMLNTDLRVELMRSHGEAADGLDLDRLRADFATMEADGRVRLGALSGEVVFSRSADMRYGEQVYEITVSLDGLDWAAPSLADDIAGAFHRAHEAMYTYALPDQPPVLVNARLSATGRLPSPAAQTVPEPTGPVEAPRTRRAYLGAWREVPAFTLERMAPGPAVAGPALIDSATTTVLVPEGTSARLDGRGWLELRVGV
jgi:N-methylhydantoinase A